VPSLAAAWFAPFPQSDSKDDDSSVDEADRLGAEDTKMQAAARRATILALLAAALFLYPDILIIGWMSSATSGGWLVFFLLLIASSTILKVMLAVRAIRAGRAALDLSRKLSGGQAYVSNAKGAVIGGAVMLACSLALVFVCVRKASETDWACAFSGDAASCVRTEEVKTSQCAHPTVDRSSAIFAAFRGLF